MRVFLIGYPGEMGGANTEAWHTIKLWRRAGIEVHLIPTWGRDDVWRRRLAGLGCKTHHVRPEDLERVPGLAGSPVVGMCNQQFTENAHRFRALGCPLVWVNCMTFLFEHEKRSFARSGLPDAFVFQSEFQRSQIEPQLAEFGYRAATGHLIRGAFDLRAWRFRPRPHGPGEPFVVGRMARPDLDKWSRDTWAVYGRIQYRNRWARLLGVDSRTQAKLGPAPEWAQCLGPMAMPVPEFLASLHCLLPLNGGARENWPRAGLEAMAVGVPIVAENQWGWREMIEHGVTGFLGDCQEELAHYAAVLAYDEELRREMIRKARKRLEKKLANPEVLWRGWRKLFRSLPDSRDAVA